MTQPLSINTQAILLLTAPLVLGRDGSARECLSLREYNQLARALRERQRQPADFLGREASDLLTELNSQGFDGARLERLLGRGFLLSQAIDRWRIRSIWVMSRADAGYPRRWKSRLREDAPPVVYGCGDVSNCGRGGLAVVGSRNADDEQRQFSQSVGRLAAAAGCTIVSGGARGVDSTAVDGALAGGGVAVSVLADGLERAVLKADRREHLSGGRLTLVSPFEPSASFNVGHAMQRNKLVYALADLALVVTSDIEKGGTWAGAIEQLERLHLVPVFVRSGVAVEGGNLALLKRGGRPWPNPDRAETLSALIQSVANSSVQGQADSPLPLLDLPQ